MKSWARRPKCTGPIPTLSGTLQGPRIAYTARHHQDGAGLFRGLLFRSYSRPFLSLLGAQSKTGSRPVRPWSGRSKAFIVPDGMTVFIPLASGRRQKARKRNRRKTKQASIKKVLTMAVACTPKNCSGLAAIMGVVSRSPGRCP